MPQLKNNHTIPKCLIKEWAVEGLNYKGVYVYQYVKDRIHFSSGKGSGGYSFAIESDIYVPQKNAERIIAVEKWLGGTENTLNIFLREIKSNNKKHLLRSKKNFNMFLLALFSVRHRSKHNLKSIGNFLIDNPNYKEKINSGEENMSIVVLENFIHSTIEEAMRFENCELIIAKSQSCNLILGDRPFLFNEDQDDYSFVPLTPHYLLSIRKIRESSYYFINENALTDEMVHSFNQMIAQNSREWIVASNEQQLNNYVPYTKVEREEQTPFYEPVQKLVTGYRLE